MPLSRARHASREADRRQETGDKENSSSKFSKTNQPSTSLPKHPRTFEARFSRFVSKCTFCIKMHKTDKTDKMHKNEKGCSDIVSEQPLSIFMFAEGSKGSLPQSVSGLVARVEDQRERTGSAGVATRVVRDVHDPRPIRVLPVKGRHRVVR